MSVLTMPNATIDDLMKYKPRAELINGRIVPMMPNGYLSDAVADNIIDRLRDFARSTGTGRQIGGTAAYGFQSPLPSGRLSISPDASFYTGSMDFNLRKYIPGFPIF